MERDARAEVENMLREGWQVHWSDWRRGLPCPICGTTDTEHMLVDDAFARRPMHYSTYKCRNNHPFIVRDVRFCRPRTPEDEAAESR